MVAEDARELARARNLPGGSRRARHRRDRADAPGVGAEPAAPRGRREGPRRTARAAAGPGSTAHGGRRAGGTEGRLPPADARRQARRGGGASERLYRRLGWTVVGSIPRYALDTDGVTPHDTVVFYKELTITS